MISIYTTHPTKEAASTIIDILLSEGLIACANFSVIESRYPWKGKIESTSEVLALLKTIDVNWERVRDRIIELHSYEIPCIIKYDVEANESYEKWIAEITKH